MSRFINRAVLGGGQLDPALAGGPTPTPTPTPTARLAGASGGQSLGEYPYLRGTPNVEVTFAQSLRSLFGLTGSAAFTRYNTNTVVHDGSSATADDWTVRLDNYASGGSAVLSSNATASDKANGNYWWNNEDNTGVTGGTSAAAGGFPGAQDVANSPGPLLRNSDAGITARTAAGFPPDFFDWSQGTAEGGLNGNDALTATYKTVLRDQVFGRIRTAAGRATLPIFIYRNGSHQTADSDAQERVRQVQTQLAAEMTACYIAAEEYPYRRAITGGSTGDTTLGSNIITNVASLTPFGLKQGIEAAGFPVGAYVSVAPSGTSLTVSIRVNGVEVPCNAMATATGVPVYNLDNVHLYPGSTAQPLDTNGSTAHNGTDGFYAVRAAGARRIAQVFGKGGVTSAQGPYIGSVAALRGQNTITVTIAHVSGTDFTIHDNTGWRVTLDGTVTAVQSVAKVSATQVTLTLANDIYAANIGVEYAYGTLNTMDRSQIIFDNSTPIAYPMQATGFPVTGATAVQSAYQSETTTLVAAMATAPTTNRKIAIDSRIARLKAAGVWTLKDVDHVVAAADEQSALLDWRNPARALAKVSGTTGVTFVADRGYTGINVATDYLDFGYNPSANAGGDSKGMATNSGHASVFALTAGTSSTASLADGSNRMQVRARSGSGALVKVNGSTTTALTDGTGAPCSVVGARSDATNQSAYRNGAFVVTGANASVNLPGALTLLKTSDQQVAMASVGQGLTAPQIAAMYVADFQYLKAVGAV